MKTYKIKLICLAIFCLFSTEIFAQSFVGITVDGGGVDDMFIEIKDSGGHIVHAYCHKACGDWFFSDKEDISRLKPIYKNRKVVVDVFSRVNKGEIAGPSDDEVLVFINKINFVRE